MYSLKSLPQWATLYRGQSPAPSHRSQDKESDSVDTSVWATIHSACSGKTATVWNFWGVLAAVHISWLQDNRHHPVLPICSFRICGNNTYVASSFTSGHHDKASETSVPDQEKAAYSLPMHCHLLSLIHLDIQKKCALTQSHKISVQ